MRRAIAPPVKPEGPARQAALEEAAEYVASFLTAYTATIEMEVDGSDTEDGTLAAAGSSPTTAGRFEPSGLRCCGFSER